MLGVGWALRRHRGTGSDSVALGGAGGAARQRRGAFALAGRDLALYVSLWGWAGGVWVWLLAYGGEWGLVVEGGVG